jgi:hypothetical protein
MIELPLASLASEPYVIEENGKEIASMLSPLTSLATPGIYCQRSMRLVL